MTARVGGRFAIFSLFLVCAMRLVAQPPRPTDVFSSTAMGDPSQAQVYRSVGAVLVLTVVGANHELLDRQSVVKLENKTTHAIRWLTTADQSEVSFGDLSSGEYEIEASAVGYLSAKKSYQVGSLYTSYRLEISLQRDPNAVEIQAPNAPDLSKKARKEIQRGVRALKSGNLKEAQNSLGSANKLAPNSADVSFLLGYLYFLKQDFHQAESFLTKASTEDPRNVQVLTLLGRIRLHEGNDIAARGTLEEAVATDPDYWLAHKFLAIAYLRQHEFEKSLAQCQMAIAKSKGAGVSVDLTLAAALANLGRTEEAISTLNGFLRSAPDNTQAGEAQNLIKLIKDRAAALPKVETLSTTVTLISPSDSVADDTDLRLSIKSWLPPGIDDEKPSVASGVSCPTDKLMTESGIKVEQFANDISKFSAIEDLVHERVDELGHAITKETRKYNYVAQISEARPGYLEVEEYRTQNLQVPVPPADTFPDGMVTNGFPSLALVFHPDMRDNFEFVCEGLGELQGQATWLIHFRQRDDRPNRIHEFKVGGLIYPVNLKGRAWVSAGSFQIVRIEAQLVKPMPDIQLLTEREIVDYGPVQFHSKDVELWLPIKADLYFDFRKHRYYRQHSFSHFMLFSTDSQDKVSGPKKEPKLNDGTQPN
ncbi:MAG TPA: tetratricopeptide repeat protein [Terriglobales bacterium]|nr:tetratricopeptide repeat protein [Terriglobales bacterium]